MAGKMKFLRFIEDGNIKTAYLDEDKIIELKGDILDYFDADIDFIKENIVKSHSMEDVKITNPTNPSKVICIGLNYREHAEELELELPKTPTIFIKPSTSVIGEKDNIIKPEDSDRVDYEAELGVVIGKDCKDVEIEDAADYIFGFTVVNDVTARDIQDSDGQWTRSKSYDTFCPIGPIIDTEFVPANQKIQSILDGEIRQDSRLSNMIFSSHELLSFMSKVMTLKAGDVIATGTPSGIGKMSENSKIEIRIEGLATLSNYLIIKK